MFKVDDKRHYEYFPTTKMSEYKKLAIVHMLQWTQCELRCACDYIKELEEELKHKDITLANYRNNGGDNG